VGCFTGSLDLALHAAYALFACCPVCQPLNALVDLDQPDQPGIGKTIRVLVIQAVDIGGRNSRSALVICAMRAERLSLSPNMIPEGKGVVLIYAGTTFMWRRVSVVFGS
jgi:hypothetical protein